MPRREEATRRRDESPVAMQHDVTTYHSYSDLGRSLGVRVNAEERPVVCVQGLGFVGAAMATAVAAARGPEGEPWFNVVGVDLPTEDGRTKVDAINAGRVPIPTNDRRLEDALWRARDDGNILATTDPDVYALASVVVVDVPLDVVPNGDRPTVQMEGFRSAIRTLGQTLRPGALVVIETTVPPGTTEKVAAPELARGLEERGLPPDAVLLAHAYERVMPGSLYLESIVSFWRAYAGHTPEAADACGAFLSKVVDVGAYPLTRLHSTTASETAKVLENSYRATTIALMEEWGRFAEAVGVDLFEVIAAIRLRPTHSNMRQPGFGVGGYCLTKDPLLAGIAARELFNMPHLDFPFSRLAVAANNAMPLASLERVTDLLGGDLDGRTILLLGVSYRSDVGDTRYSPSEIFVRAAQARGATVLCHDPLVDSWPELDATVLPELPAVDGIDAVVFAVPHAEYSALDLEAWFDSARPAVLDANNVLSEAQRKRLRAAGCAFASIGRGDAG